MEEADHLRNFFVDDTEWESAGDYRVCGIRYLKNETSVFLASSRALASHLRNPMFSGRVRMTALVFAARCPSPVSGERVRV
jgi:hypothetical protein